MLGNERVFMNVPSVIFKTRENDYGPEGQCFLGNWKPIQSDNFFANKKIVLVSIPGAFTPTCTSTHIPGYESNYEKLRLYVDEVYCISVNDAFVMNAWGKQEGIEKVKLLPDGEGNFTKGMGMLVSKPMQGFGKRSWRYSAYIENGLVVKMFVEAGLNNESNDDDPFEVSDAVTMLSYLASK
ncbi:MAG: peroxiredoxin [Chloroflexi bacterium]|nr:peroxiredoxin [Chloroflexota bacterium]